jgi:adenosylcobinamide-GDP ribazoletransferase
MKAISSGWAHDLARDIRIGILICTRLPLGSPPRIESLDLVRASWALPVAGALVGAAGAWAFWIASELRLPPAVAAALAVVATLLVTGGLHEDGLADTADGFGGGWDRGRKLEIMRDSRLGTYGALILLVSFATKLSALAAIPDGYVVQSLIASHALARGVLPWMSMSLPYARKDGLAANAGRPDAATAAIAAALALAVALLSLSFANALGAALVACLSAAGMARLAQRQIGGQTGDVLGGAEQVAETVILVLLAARLA